MRSWSAGPDDREVGGVARGVEAHEGRRRRPLRPRGTSRRGRGPPALAHLRGHVARRRGWCGRPRRRTPRRGRAAGRFAPERHAASTRASRSAFGPSSPKPWATLFSTSGRSPFRSPIFRGGRRSSTACTSIPAAAGRGTPTRRRRPARGTRGPHPCSCPARGPRRAGGRPSRRATSSRASPFSRTRTSSARRSGTNAPPASVTTRATGRVSAAVARGAAAARRARTRTRIRSSLAAPIVRW